MSNQQKNGSIIAIVTMFFLYAMIAFVTNLGAPIGVIWKSQPGIDGNNMLGMMGNFMNFFAYLFMGIPAGKMLTKIGYKKSALIGIAVGFFGVLIQFISSFPTGIAGFCVYLLGAFISGFLKNRTPHRQPSGPVIGAHFSFHYYPIRVSTRYSFKNGSV